MAKHDEEDKVHRAANLARSLLGWVESWEKRPKDEFVSDRSRRMLVSDLIQTIDLFRDDEELIGFIAEVSALKDPLTFADGAEQVKWFALRICGAYNVNPRTLRQIRRIEPAAKARDNRLAVALPPDDVTIET